MESISIVNYIKTNLSGQLHNVLELGSGDQSEATQIAAQISGEYFAIDKKAIDKTVNSRIISINADYFDIGEVDKVIHDKKFDLIFSNYSLCFNKKDIIIERLPYYFNKLEKNGVFYIGDFTDKEQIVKKRTNLHDEWFFNMIKTYFNSFTISEHDVYEKEHGHNHDVFELVCFGKK